MRTFRDSHKQTSNKIGTACTEDVFRLCMDTGSYYRVYRSSDSGGGSAPRLSSDCIPISSSESRSAVLVLLRWKTNRLPAIHGPRFRNAFAMDANKIKELTRCQRPFEKQLPYSMTPTRLMMRSTHSKR